jgi:hypothetical protein
LLAPLKVDEGSPSSIIVDESPPSSTFIDESGRGVNLNN